ncbi:MAG: nucleotidyl transferase AbiEii/AbiGii toxin family protein [Lachnospiraceae bacterium]|nr:nucleotidyl transferase AbiEii/AbiGii toxin family protein [Lachnospiraceae bacterium]
MVYLHENRDLFTEALNLAVFKTGLKPEIIEKDYYVTMILKKLSEQFDYAVFKGGTSLQKCYCVISRFSEDIDITIDETLSQSEKKKLKYGIVGIAKELNLEIPNIEDTRSRRDYNRYELTYDSVLNRQTGAVKPSVLLETSFSEISFPTVTLPVHSYMGDLFEMEAPSLLELYQLDVFQMKVQSLERTLIDKVFALCDYYLQGNVRRHSRHLYDIYKLYPLVAMDEAFRGLIKEVREVRSKTTICPSAISGVDVPKLLREIEKRDVYKEDYNVLTVRLLNESVSYEDTLMVIRKIAESGFFGE